MGPILKTLLLHPKVVRDSRCRCPNIFSRSRRQTLHHLTSKYEMCDQIRKTQFLSQIKECVNNNFCISVEFYIVLCTVFQLCFCPLEFPNFSDKIPSLSIKQIFLTRRKNFLCPGNLPTHDYQQPICLSNKCHHLLQLQSSSRGMKAKRITLSLHYYYHIISPLFFESISLSLNMMMKISICQKTKRKNRKKKKLKEKKKKKKKKKS